MAVYDVSFMLQLINNYNQQLMNNLILEKNIQGKMCKNRPSFRCFKSFVCVEDGGRKGLKSF